MRMLGDCGRLDAELEHLLRELRLLQDLIHRTPLLLGPPNRASTEMDGSPSKTVRAQALCRHTVQIIPSWQCRLRVSLAVRSRVYPLRPTKKGCLFWSVLSGKTAKGAGFGEAGPLWSVMHVWLQRVYCDVPTAAFTQIKPAKINIPIW